MNEDTCASSSTLSREEALKLQAERLQQLQTENPAMDLELGSNWWAPGIYLAFDVRGALDKETNEKLNAILLQAITQQFAPGAVNTALSEARKCLARHDEILQRFNAIFETMNDKQWAAYHDITKQQNKPSV